MLLRVLGSLQVDGVDGPVEVGGALPRRILCALLVKPGATVSVGSLIEAAWGTSPPKTADRTLISHISRLREALEQANAKQLLIERRDSGYRLVVEPDSVDTARFERIVLGVRDLRAAEAASALDEALALWRAPGPFADLQDTAYPAGEAARLVELHGFAVEALVAAHLEVGDAVSAAAVAQARLGENPYRERLWELLVLALYRQGRQGDALETYRQARVELADGLGVDPGPGLRQLEARVLAQDPGLLAVAVQPRRPCPYKGLARYDAGDADLFVGRERLVDELLARLVDQRYLVVVGSSGAGKSSLVRAGLVPALWAGALPGSQAWSVAVITPGGEPLQALTDTVAGRPDVVVVDQAEEAMLADNGSYLVAFGDRLLAAVGAGIRVVLVVRADFFGLLAGHPELARRSGPATVLVGPPDERELRRIITEPAARVGLRVEPALADLIVAEVRDRPGLLPVLSTALVRTWERRDADVLSVACYRAGGGVAAALQRVGEEAWSALSDDAQRGACRRLLLRLAVDEDGSWVRRWARRAEAVPQDDPAAVAALAVMTDHRLVVARADDIGIAHEALLTGWPRLYGWLEDGRSRAAVRERLAAAATAWQEADHDAGELYRGTRLQAALDVAAAHPDDLTSLERAFLTESAQEAERQLAQQRARADREARGRRTARLVAAGLAIALVFATSAGVYAIVQGRRAERAATAADAGRLGALARSGGPYDRSLLLAAQAVALDPSPASESDLFATLLRGDAVVATMRAPFGVPAVALTPDGRSVVAVTFAGQLTRWPAGGGPQEPSLSLGSYAGKVAMTADGQPVASFWRASTNLPAIAVLDPRDGKVLQEGPAIDVNVWSLSQDRHVVVAGGPMTDLVAFRPSSTYVVVWRLGTPATHAQQVDIGEAALQITACGLETACVLTSSRRLVRIRIAEATVDGSYALPPDTVEGLIGSPDGRTLAITRPDGIVRIVDARTGRELRQLGGGDRDVRVLAFSPDGSRLVAGDFTTVLVWRNDRAGLPEKYEAHDGRVLSADWSADGSTLATAGEGGTVILWDTTGRRRAGAVLTNGLAEDASTVWPVPGAIVVGQANGRVLFVNPADGTIQTSGPPATAPIVTARSGRAGDLLVTADNNGDTAVWDIPARRLLGAVELPRNSPGYLADVWLSPDGTQAATIRSHAGPIVFDPATRKVLRQLPPLQLPGSDPTVVQGWTADGRSLLIAGQSPTGGRELLVLDATTGAVKLRVSTGDATVLEAAADPNGRFIALAMSDGTLRLADPADGHLLAPPMLANAGPILNVSISPDGRYIATSGEPPRLVVWDTRTFRQVGIALPLDVDARQARARFAPDGRLIVATGTTLRIFTIDPAQWLARACREAGRTLTPAEFEEVLPNRRYAPACA